MKIKVKDFSNPNGIRVRDNISITKSNFLASGGEGDVYVKDSLAYKIYHNPSKMIPEGKMSELSAITDPNVIRPMGVVIDSKNKPIGYTMRYVKDTYALCQLFTKAFRNRNNLSHDQMQSMVRKLYELVSNVHKADALIVDLNEMNFLASHDFAELYAIDTDSYQTKSYPATAIMESIRDRHSKSFNKNTDWFSYGIISFQMFTGIHPYKGKHPQIKNMDDRMSQNISVFNKDVKIPAACYGTDVIPEAYKQWYKAVFDEGKRIEPPVSFDNVNVVINVDVVKGTDNIIIDLIGEYKGSIKSVISHGGLRVLTDSVFYTTKHKCKSVSNDCISFLTPNGVPMIARLERGDLKLYDSDSNKEIPCKISGDSLMVSENNLYIKSGTNIFLLDLFEAPGFISSTIKTVATVLESASKFFDGVLIQNLLGSFYVSIFPEAGKHYQIQMNELDGNRVVDAKYESGVFMAVVADKDGKYHRMVFRFDKNFSSYDYRIVENITPIGLNFVVFDNGICVYVNEIDQLTLFSSKKDSSGYKIVQDKVISSDMKLFKSGSKLLFSKHNKLYSATMK